MELMTESLYMEEKKGPAVTQVTFDETYHLPDYLPDFFSVILREGSVQTDESKCGTGQVIVKGTLKFHVLYQTRQGECNIASLEGEFPYQETVVLEGCGEFDMPQTEVVLEDLTIRMMNARKLNVRALMEIRVQTRERKKLDIPVGIAQNQGEEPLEMQTQTENYLELCYRGSERAKIREEVQLPANKPNIHQILWSQIQLMGMETHVVNGSVTLQGDIQLFLIYQGMEDHTVQWLEQRLPYQSSLSISEAEHDMIPHILAGKPVFSCKEKEDADGEMRVVLMETDLLMDLWLYRERKTERLLDAYSLEYQLNLHEQPVTTYSLCMKNEAKCRVNDILNIQDQEHEILQISSGTGQAEVEHWEIQGNSVRVDGTVNVQILYLSSSDSMPVGAVEGLLPFQCEIDVLHMPEDPDVELQALVEHLSFLMKTGTELEVQAVISVEVFVTEMKKTTFIDAVETEALDAKWMEQIPGIAGIRIAQENDLWEIAKKFHTTEADIRKINQIEGQTLTAGQKILVVKQGIPQI